MRNMLEKMLRCYGTKAEILHGGAASPVRAIIQPTRSKAKRTMEGDHGPLGDIPQGQYTYIGPVGQPVAQGDYLLVGVLRLRFRRVETIFSGDEPLYHWGLCMEVGEEDTWALNS